MRDQEGIFFKVGEITPYLYTNGSDSVETGKLVERYLH